MNLFDTNVLLDIATADSVWLAVNSIHFNFKEKYRTANIHLSSQNCRQLSF